MSGSPYLTFEAVVTPMEWGKSVYTIVVLPPEIVAELGNTRRVEGEFNDYPVNLALTKAPAVEGVFVYTGKSVLGKIGVKPGEPFEARLRPVSADVVEVPADVRNAVLSAGVLSRWEGLSAGKQRGTLHQVETAKRAETRMRRIGALIAALKEG